MPPADLPRMLNQAARLREAGRLRQAAVVYRRALHTDPANPDILYPLALVARDMGRTDAALPLLRRAAAAGPPDPAVHRSLGDLCLALGRFAEAVDAYRLVSRLAPDDPQVYARLGRALARLDRWPEAAQAYDRAADLGGMLADPPAVPMAADADDTAAPASGVLSPMNDVGTAISITPVTEPAATPGAVFSAVVMAPADLVVSPVVSEPAAVEPVGIEPISTDLATTIGPAGTAAEPADGAASQVGLESIRLETLDAESFAGAFEIVTPAPGQSAVIPRDVPSPVPGPPPAEPAAVQPEGGPLAAGPVATGAIGTVLDEPASAQAGGEPADATSDPVVAGPEGPDGGPWFADGLAGLDDLDDAALFVGGSIPGEEGLAIVGPIPPEPRVTGWGDGDEAAPLSAEPEVDADVAERLFVDDGAVAIPPAPATDLWAGPPAEPPAEAPELASEPPAPDVVAPVGPAAAETASAVTAVLETVAAPADPPADVDVAPPAPPAESIATVGAAVFGVDFPSAEPDDVLSADPEPLQPLEPVVPDAPLWSAFPPAVAAALAPARDAAAGLELAERPDEEDDLDVDDDIDGDEATEAADESLEASADPAAHGALSPEELLHPRILRRKRRKKRAREKVTAAVDLRRRGHQMMRVRKLDEAVACFSRLVEMQPRSAKAHRDLGAALLRDDRLEEAVAQFRRALELRPRFADAYGSLGDAYHLQGKLDQAISCYRNVLRLKPSAARAHSNLLLTLNYSHKYDPRAVLEEHLRWARYHAAPLARHIQPHTNDCDPGRTLSGSAESRLRVGYVSPDFRRHSVNYFVEPVLARHDHDRFAVYCYSDAIRPDDVTERIAGYCDGWRDVRGMTDEDVARLVRDDRIDILVDLSGHTGSNRLLVFARKPAPVQVTYLGYPNTTGLSTIDYRVTDAYADPPGKTEALNTEALGWMPETFLCYAPPDEAPPPGEPPMLAAGHVTFGCFNILAKVTPDVMGLWARILAAVPGSRLVMKDRAGVFAYPARRQYVQDIFRYHGIAADRLDLCDKEPDYGKHLETYRRVDVMLDPFPYNGTTTTCEALWMGLPVITLAGATHVGRVGVSILSNVELRELIATTPEEYVRKGVAAANDRDGLLFLRETLRDRMRRSPLMAAERFTRSLEEMYRQMWLRWCDSAGRKAGQGEDDGPQLTLTDA